MNVLPDLLYVQQLFSDLDIETTLDGARVRIDGHGYSVRRFIGSVTAAYVIDELMYGQDMTLNYEPTAERAVEIIATYIKRQGKG